MVLGMVACSDDTTGPDEPTLTLEESEALLEAIQGITLLGSDDDLPSSGGTETLSCPGGGEVVATGTVMTSETGTSSAATIDVTRSVRQRSATVHGLA